MSFRRRHCLPAPTLVRSRNRGFTLIEVMIATAIMSVGIVSALQAFSGAMRLAGAASRQTEALVLARSLLDEAYWQAALQEDSYSGEEGPFTWNVEVGPVPRSLFGPEGGLEQDAGDYELYGIFTEVSWVAAGGRKRIFLSSARLAEAEFSR